MSFAQPFSGYEILARIGSGAMGTVFKARQKRLNRVVALKVLRPSLARDERYVERLRREAHIVATLNHPNIVAGYDLGEEGGYHFFVMEHVEGRSLKELLKEWGMFPEDRVLDVAIQIAGALDHAYERGVIHRDVKPGNILIDAGNRVKLTDMGLAKGPTDLTITRDGATVGTPQYISPEQATDPQSADVRSDLWSLGATLFHMATGQPPFGGETMAQVLRGVLYGRTPSPRELNPQLSDGFALVIRKLLAKDRELRYQTPAELLADLQRVQRAEHPAIDARQLDRAEHGGERRWLPRAAAVAGVLALVVTAWTLWSGDRTATPRNDGASAWRQRLAADLAAAPTLGDKLRVLQAAEATVADEGPDHEDRPPAARVREVVTEERTRLLARQLGAFLASEPVRLRAWFDDLRDWRELELAARTRVGVDLHEVLGVEPHELPAEQRALLEERAFALQRDVQRWQVERERAYLAQLEAHLAGEVAEACRRCLRRQDFAAAAAALLEGIEAFHGSRGRPTRVQLPDAVLQQVRQREGEHRDRGLQDIAFAEDQTADALRREADDAIRELRGALQQLRPQDVRDRLRRLEQRLAAHYPPAEQFRLGRNPWPDVDRELRTFAMAVDHAIAAAEEQRLTEALGRCYALLLRQGDARDEVRYLSQLELEHSAAVELRRRHAPWVEAARLAADRVLGDFAAKPGAPHELPRANGEGSGRYVVRRAEPGWRLAEVVGAREVAVPLSAVAWSSLLPQRTGSAGAGEASGAEQAATIRLGRAFWLAASGCGGALDLLQDEEASFLANRVRPLLERARALHGEPSEPALTALQRLQQAYEEREVDSAAEALAALQQAMAGVPALAEHTTALRTEVAGWIRDEQMRRQVVSRLDLPGAQVQVTGERLATVTYGPAGLQQHRREPWRADGAGIVWPATATPAHALARALEVATGMSNEQTVTVLAELRFLPAGQRTAVHVLEAHGVAAVVVVLPSEGIAAFLCKAEASHRTDALVPLLAEPIAQAALRPAALVVTEAAHRLRLVLRPTRDRSVHATLDLDGQILAADGIVRAPKPKAAVRIAATEPLAVQLVTIEGVPQQ